MEGEGRGLPPSHANKGGKRYRYYVSEALMQGKGADPGGAIRLPAREVENAVKFEIARFLENSRKLIDALAAPDDDVGFRQRLGNLGTAAALRLRDDDPSFSQTAILAFVSRVVVGQSVLTVTCSR